MLSLVHPVSPHGAVFGHHRQSTQLLLVCALFHHLSGTEAHAANRLALTDGAYLLQAIWSTPTQQSQLTARAKLPVLGLMSSMYVDTDCGTRCYICCHLLCRPARAIAIGSFSLRTITASRYRTGDITPDSRMEFLGAMDNTDAPQSCRDRHDLEMLHRITTTIELLHQHISNWDFRTEWTLKHGLQFVIVWFETTTASALLPLLVLLLPLLEKQKAVCKTAFGCTGLRESSRHTLPCSAGTNVCMIDTFQQRGWQLYQQQAFPRPVYRVVAVCMLYDYDKPVRCQARLIKCCTSSRTVDVATR